MGSSGGGGSDGGGDRQAQPLLGKLSESESSYSSSDEHLVNRTGESIDHAPRSYHLSVPPYPCADIASSSAALLAVCRACTWGLGGGGARRHGMDGDGAHNHGGDRVRRAVAGVERGAAGMGGRAGGHGVLRRRHRGAVHPDRRLLHFPRPGARRRQEPLLRRRRAPLPRAIQKANCYHKEGHDAPCSVGGDVYYMLVFGLAQVVLSQIPDFHEMAGLSVFAAAMSFFYSFVGVGLGIAKVIANGVIMGGIGGIPMVTTTRKVWRVSQAVGDILFAYPFSLVLLEIEDTLRPPETETMKTATRASIGITTLFYLCCGCFGYAAFGDATPGNLLTGFGFYEPYWLIDLANLCIVLHLLGGYQVYTQPVFAFLDRKFGGGATVVVVEVPLLGTRRVNAFRLCFRTAYVAATTALAVWFPYFNQVIGLLGAFTFWPLAVYFPVEMYLTRNKVAPWSNQWLAVHGFSLVCLLISAFASVGSAVGVFGSETS